MYLKQDIKEQLLTKKPIDLLFQLSIPAVIGMIVIGLYPLMDGIFAGKIIGQTAMTACGVAMPLTFFNSGVSTLLGVGSASVLSRAIGKGDQKTVDKIMGKLNLLGDFLLCNYYSWRNTSCSAFFRYGRCNG